jgi:transposase
VSIHRLEILAGSVRRRKFTQAAKEAVVSETLTGDATVTDVARRHGLDRSLVYRWRREFGVVEHVGTAISFVPVNVEAPDLSEPQIVRQVGAIDIHVGQGRSVRVGAGFDAATLTRVLRVLEAQ